MEPLTTLCVGSLDALVTMLSGVAGDFAQGTDVVVVPTAAAFTGPAEAAWSVATMLAPLDLRVEALMVADRAASAEAYFAQRIRDADLVVLCDGSPLHARTVWRDTPVGEAIDHAGRLVAVGAVATVIGDLMIDPRGGAPTTGLGYRAGLVIAVASSDEQLTRTRDLLGDDQELCVLGHEDAIGFDRERWRVVLGAPVVTRGREIVELGLGDRH